MPNKIIRLLPLRFGPDNTFSIFVNITSNFLLNSNCKSTENDLFLSFKNIKRFWENLLVVL